MGHVDLASERRLGQIGGSQGGLAGGGWPT